MSIISKTQILKANYKRFTDSDIFYNSDKSLKIVNNFIKKNYSFSEKFSYWEIYKIKVKNR